MSFDCRIRQPTFPFISIKFYCLYNQSANYGDILPNLFFKVKVLSCFLTLDFLSYLLFLAMSNPEVHWMN